MEKIKPLKRFGQNYIKDQNILNKILKEINPQADEKILEIGPGLGSLTGLLLKCVPSLTAVEIDKRVIEILSKKFPGLDLISDDFLNLELNKIYLSAKKKLRIVGNIPYNLSSSIIFKMIENNSIISDAVIMVQNEVAQRMIAIKGTKDYGILSVILDYFSMVEVCFKISPNVFYPKPKVISSLVHIYFKDLKETLDEQKNFLKVVKAAFGNRRKKLINSLVNNLTGTEVIDFKSSGVDLSLRAEQLDTVEFKKLADFIFNKSRKYSDCFHG